MPKSRKWINLGIAALFVVFGYGALHLYLLRFTAGDVYPPYSSFRADPVGTRALYESLKELDGVSVKRHAQPFSSDSVRNTVGNLASTWLVLGTDAHDPDHAPPDIVTGVEQVMQHGGRVVIAFSPTGKDLRKEFEKWEEREERMQRMRERRRGKDDKADEGDEPEKGANNEASPNADRSEESQATSKDDQPTESVDAKKSESPDKSPEDDETNEDDEKRNDYEDMFGPTVDIEKHWGVRLEFDPVQVDAEDKIAKQDAKLVADDNLPKNVTWHTATSFDTLSDEWQVLYERDDKPVVIERPFGAGTLVFASDTYFLSNEALRDERHPRLLSWMVGDNDLIVFEESHLGVAHVPGVMTLIRGYGLYGVFWGLIGLAVLYLWKNAVPFVPPYRDEAPSDARHAAGRDSAAGFANLIRRSVAPRKLLQTCIAQYRNSLGARQRDLAEPIRQMESIAAQEDLKPANERNPVSAYRAMCRVLKEYVRG